MASNIPDYPTISSKKICRSHLNEKDQFRYKQKLQVSTKLGTVICSDPYLIDNWHVESNKWPKIDYPQIIGYFIKRPGLYTLEDLSNQRSLESYNFVT